MQRGDLFGSTLNFIAGKGVFELGGTVDTRWNQQLFEVAFHPLDVEGVRERLPKALFERVEVAISTVEKFDRLVLSPTEDVERDRWAFIRTPHPKESVAQSRLRCEYWMKAPQLCDDLVRVWRVSRRTHLDAFRSQIYGRSRVGFEVVDDLRECSGVSDAPHDVVSAFLAREFHHEVAVGE